ncbi:hypothetical protein [Hungatella hathewayi]|uniref:hypothetical protein n=1 Tax=Hungatella hathewayi TaxID=154046 RepID=UPI00356775BC
MEKIKAIKSTEKLCWKCLQEKENIHKLEFGPLGYGSMFDCCSTQLQLCDECYEASNPEIWSLERVYDNEEYKEYGWCHYKHENKMSEYFATLPIEGRQLVMNEYWMGDHYMEPQDWIDYELGILPHEIAKDYGLYSTQEIAAYEERFPRCQWPVNRIFKDGSKGCWCPFGAHGDYNQEVKVNISEECYKCPYYSERPADSKIYDIQDDEFYKYEILTKAAMIRKEHKEMEVLLFYDFDTEKFPSELLAVANQSTDLLGLRGNDVIKKLREIAYPIDELPGNDTDGIMLEICRNKIVYDKKNDVYLYAANDEKRIRKMKIVTINASKDWAIVENDKEEKVVYIEPVHSLIGFYKLT